MDREQIHLVNEHADQLKDMFCNFAFTGLNFHLFFFFFGNNYCEVKETPKKVLQKLMAQNLKPMIIMIMCHL